MFAIVAEVLKKAGLNPHVRTDVQEILLRDVRNQLWIVTVRHVGKA